MIFIFQLLFLSLFFAFSSTAGKGAPPASKMPLSVESNSAYPDTVGASQISKKPDICIFCSETEDPIGGTAEHLIQEYGCHVFCVHQFIEREAELRSDSDIFDATIIKIKNGSLQERLQSLLVLQNILPHLPAEFFTEERMDSIYHTATFLIYEAARETVLFMKLGYMLLKKLLQAGFYQDKIYQIALMSTEVNDPEVPYWGFELLLALYKVNYSSGKIVEGLSKIFQDSSLAWKRVAAAKLLPSLLSGNCGTMSIFEWVKSQIKLPKENDEIKTLLLRVLMQSFYTCQPAQHQTIHLFLKDLYANGSKPVKRSVLLQIKQISSPIISPILTEIIVNAKNSVDENLKKIAESICEA